MVETYILSGSSLFPETKTIITENTEINALFIWKLQPSIHRYIQWAFSSLKYQARRKNPLLHKWLKKKNTQIYTEAQHDIYDRMWFSPPGMVDILLSQRLVKRKYIPTFELSCPFILDTSKKVLLQKKSQPTLGLNLNYISS